MYCCCLMNTHVQHFSLGLEYNKLGNKGTIVLQELQPHFFECDACVIISALDSPLYHVCVLSALSFKLYNCQALNRDFTFFILLINL